MLTKKALGLMIGALLSGALIGGEAAAGQTLADFHSKMGGCASCHGTNAVTAASVPDDERALNAQCQTCHGSYKPEFADLFYAYGVLDSGRFIGESSHLVGLGSNQASFYLRA